MALSLFLAALIAQAQPPAQSGPRPSFIICPGNPRCPRSPREQLRGQAPPDQPAQAAIARPDPTAETGRIVYFAVSSAALDDQARAVLERVADWLAANPQHSVNIEGHADARGSREANLALAARRAESVREFLAARGIAPARLTTISYGEERPALHDSGEPVWMMNRRVEIQVR